MQQILVEGLSADELLQKIGVLIDQKISSSTLIKFAPQDEFLSRKQVCELLKITLPTLNTWTKAGWLTGYKIGNRVLYKNQEITLAVTTISQRKFRKHVL